MKAKIMIPNAALLTHNTLFNIMLGDSLLAAGNYRDSKYKLYGEVNFLSRADSSVCTDAEFEQHQLNFLEDVFGHTACSEAWKNKRSISVGDILEIEGGRTWFCASRGWVCIK
jgi:hypothetical protein